MGNTTMAKTSSNIHNDPVPVTVPNKRKIIVTDGATDQVALFGSKMSVQTFMPYDFFASNLAVKDQPFLKNKGIHQAMHNN